MAGISPKPSARSFTALGGWCVAQFRQRSGRALNRETGTRMPVGGQGSAGKQANLVDAAVWRLSDQTQPWQRFQRQAILLGMCQPLASDPVIWDRVDIRDAMRIREVLIPVVAHGWYLSSRSIRSPLLTQSLRPTARIVDRDGNERIGVHVIEGDVAWRYANIQDPCKLILKNDMMVRLLVNRNRS